MSVSECELSTDNGFGASGCVMCTVTTLPHSVSIHFLSGGVVWLIT